MANWWEKSSRRRSSRKSYSDSGTVRSESTLKNDAEKVSKDIADTINEEDPVLPWVFGAAMMGTVQLGRSFGKSFKNVLEWGWPSE